MTDWEGFTTYLPGLLEGAVTTIWLTLLTLLGGFVFAIPVAWCRNAKSRLARRFAFTFIFVFRGAPLLVLLYLIYFGSPELPIIRQTPLWWFFRNPLPCAVLALSLNSAGYLSEIIAGAVRLVPRGQMEAARALGLREWQVAWLVILPNVLRIAIRSYGNEVVFVVKGTSAASLVTVGELMASANQIYYQTLDPFTPMLVAGALYLGMVAVIQLGVSRVEKRFALVK